MDTEFIVNNLSRNKEVFHSLFRDVSKEQYLWKPAPGKWCMLEILCHLHDEEQFDFRARVKSVLENPNDTPPSIDPQRWVMEKNYMGQEYTDVLEKFLSERESSIKWLRSLKDPKWKNEYYHPEFGAMSAEFFLANWLAHDYLHFRQINTLKFQYLKQFSGVSLDYAGAW